MRFEFFDLDPTLGNGGLSVSPNGTPYHGGVISTFLFQDYYCWQGTSTAGQLEFITNTPNEISATSEPWLWGNVTTSFIGTDLSVSADGELLSGTITGIRYTSPGFNGAPDHTIATISGISILATDLVDAYETLSVSVTAQPLYALFFDGSNEFDASQSGHPVYFDMFWSNDHFHLQGSEGNDRLIAGNGDDTLLGNSGHDYLEAGSGNNCVFGGAGNDFLRAGDGEDTLDGGDGIDRVSFFEYPQYVYTLNINLELGRATYIDPLTQELNTHQISNIEEVIGSGQDDLIVGDDNNNILDGFLGADTIHGRGGDDFLFIRVAHNGSEIFGEEGNDTLAINQQATGVLFDGGEGFDVFVTPNVIDEYVGTTLNLTTGVHSHDIEGSTFVSIEQVFGNYNNDHLTGDATNNIFDGLQGDDTLFGMAGDDDLFGNVGEDVLAGGIGDDHLDGGDGNDLLLGGDGTDYILGDDGEDWLLGEGGRDLLSGGVGNDTLDGQFGHDTLFGDDGDDTLNGGNHNDRLDGGTGNDVLNGDLNNDALRGGAGFDTLNGGDGNDWLDGGNWSDTLNGGNGIDGLWGAHGHDEMNGGGGDDRIWFGIGNDTATGGSGADTFNFFRHSGNDVITDASVAEGDLIRIHSNLWSNSLSEIQVIAEFACLNSSGNVVLAFDSGDSLTFEGVTDLATAHDLIAII